MKHWFTILTLLIAYSSWAQTSHDSVQRREYGKSIELVAPKATKSSMNFSKVIGWPDSLKPIAPTGFKVEKFTSGMENPRWIMVAGNGDIFIVESATVKTTIIKVRDKIIGKDNADNVDKYYSANRITLFRDKNKDGIADESHIFLENLNQPLGMLILNGYFYVANTDALWRFPYTQGQDSITEKGEKILDLPAGRYNQHWARNLIANKDGSKIYISVGSGSNIAENGLDNEIDRAAIWEINPDGTGKKIYASGLRNPMGLDWEKNTGKLWVAVNERDMLGDQLVPDYITDVQENAFYGWPFAYWGKNPDPRMDGKGPEWVDRTIIPAMAIGSHTASLGLSFCYNKKFPKHYHQGAFIAQRGSWNRSVLTGYKVLFVPFEGGKPSGKTEDFLTGFIADLEKEEVYGRPVDVKFTKDYLLVTDDASNTVWSVKPIQ